MLDLLKQKLYEYGFNTYTIAKLREQNAIAKHVEIDNATKETKIWIY